MLETPLDLAAQKGFVGSIDMLVRAGAKVDATDAIGRTAVHYAAMGDHAAAIDALRRLGANISQVDRFGNTPLHIASEYEQDHAVKALLAYGAPVDAKIFKAIRHLSWLRATKSLRPWPY